MCEYDNNTLFTCWISVVHAAASTLPHVRLLQSTDLWYMLSYFKWDTWSLPHLATTVLLTRQLKQPCHYNHFITVFYLIMMDIFLTPGQRAMAASLSAQISTRLPVFFNFWKCLLPWWEGNPAKTNFIHLLHKHLSCKGHLHLFFLYNYSPFFKLTNTFTYINTRKAKEMEEGEKKIYPRLRLCYDCKMCYSRGPASSHMFTDILSDLFGFGVHGEHEYNRE